MAESRCSAMWPFLFGFSVSAEILLDLLKVTGGKTTPVL